MRRKGEDRLGRSRACRLYRHQQIAHRPGEVEVRRQNLHVSCFKATLWICEWPGRLWQILPCPRFPVGEHDGRVIEDECCSMRSQQRRLIVVTRDCGVSWSRPMSSQKRLRVS